MPIGDYSEKPAATVRGDETVRAVSQRMKQEGLGSLVVVKDEGPVGIVTDRDLVVGTLCRRLDPGSVSVAEVASRSLATIEQDAPVREAVRLIRRHAVRRLPVVDEKDQLVGIVAADDLLSLIAGELSGLAVAVRTQSPSGDPQQRGATARMAEHYHKDVATIPADVMARDAADTLKARAVGSLVVIRDGEPVGIVTDRDLLERVVADGKDAGATSVAEVMSQPLQVASTQDPLERVVELMSTKGIRRVPVVRDGALVGIVTLDDVLVEVAEELHDLAEGMRRELTLAQRGARARALARDVGDRVHDLGEQLEHLGSEAKQGLLRELDSLRERIRSRKGGEG
jgi:CBS domain-containing protein